LLVMQLILLSKLLKAFIKFCKCYEVTNYLQRFEFDAITHIAKNF
jgi:hypothetical protein